MLPLLCALTAAALVYCLLAAIAAIRYRSVRPPALAAFPPISVLKPLSGVDDGLEQNLRTVFTQDYPNFEILFAVRQPTDPAVPIVERLCREFPQISAQLLFTGEPPYPNAKVFSLDRMLARARHDLIVMSDSDIRVTPHMLRTFAAEFQDPALGLATCPYRAVPGRSFWSLLEAIGLNTEFMGGVLTARMLEGMRFALGPTIAARRQTLDAIGGFDVLKDYLAEDFVMGKLAAEKGFGVILSSYVIEHRIGAQKMKANLIHRLRWNRSSRRSRPAGYIGQFFTHPLPIALAAWAARPEWWPVLVAAIVCRALSAWAVASYALADPLVPSRWRLLPLQDFLSFACWVGGFFGNTIHWRGRQYTLLPDGRFELIQPLR